MTELTDLRVLTDKLVRDYLGFRGGAFTVLGDDETLDIASSILTSATDLADPSSELNLINVSRYRKDGPIASLPDSLRQRLTANARGLEDTVVVYVMTDFQGMESKFRGQLVFDLAVKQGKIGGIPDCTHELLEAVYHPDNKPEFVDELFELLQKETEVRITCPLGTDLTIRYDPARFNWIKSDGKLIPGKYANPFPAEVYTHPLFVDGLMVVAGGYRGLENHEMCGGNPKEITRILAETPIRLHWKESELRAPSDVECTNAEIQRFVRESVFEADPIHGRKAGESGWPANLYLLARALTGSFGPDEKGRKHVAHGHGYPKNGTGCPYNTDVHRDGLIEGPTIFSVRLQDYLMTDGAYNVTLFNSLR